jgi:tetratricopeptide (TPR) repeat protein
MMNLKDDDPMNDLNVSNVPQAPEKPSFADNLIASAIRYKNIIIGTLLVALVVAGGVFFWMKQMQGNEEKAALMLSRIMPVMESGDLRKAIDGDKTLPGLKSVIGQYGSTPSGNMARLILATAYYSMNKPDSALAMYGSFSHKNKDLEAAAFAGSGACHMQQKQFAKAAEDYEKASAAAENEALKAHYLVRAADNDYLAGQTAKARTRYNEIVRQFPGSSAAAIAQRSIWKLSGSESD